MDNETEDELESFPNMGDVSEDNIIRPSVPQTRSSLTSLLILAPIMTPMMTLLDQLLFLRILMILPMKNWIQ